MEVLELVQRNHIPRFGQTSDQAGQLAQAVNALFQAEGLEIAITCRDHARRI